MLLRHRLRQPAAAARAHTLAPPPVHVLAVRVPSLAEGARDAPHARAARVRGAAQEAAPAPPPGAGGRRRAGEVPAAGFLHAREALRVQHVHDEVREAHQHVQARAGAARGDAAGRRVRVHRVRVLRLESQEPAGSHAQAHGVRGQRDAAAVPLHVRRLPLLRLAEGRAAPTHAQRTPGAGGDEQRSGALSGRLHDAGGDGDGGGDGDHHRRRRRRRHTTAGGHCDDRRRRRDRLHRRRDGTRHANTNGDTGHHDD